jgi:diacylglycerol kinase family enzyme
MMTMFVILHNPLSKNNKSKRTTKKVVDHFKRKGIPFRLKSLLKIKDIEYYIKHTPEDINILLLGGDGTINTFINKTYSLHMTHNIYLMGNGSGNDFLRTLKQEPTRFQPILKLTHNNKQRYFMNGSGMGIDGLIAHRVNQSKNRNKFNYFFNTLKSFLTFKPTYAEITIDGELHTFKKTYMVGINNGQYFGGGMRVTPDAKLSDEFMDVIVIHGMRKVTLFLVFLSIYFGLHTKLKKYIFIKKAKHVKASMFTNQYAQCDGETYPKTQNITIENTNKLAHFKVFDWETLDKLCK